MNFPAKEDLELLSDDEKIETIKKLRLNNRIADMASGFGFNSSSNYYNWLKKLGIYEQLSSKSTYITSGSTVKPFITSEPTVNEDSGHANTVNQSAQSKQILLSNDEIIINYNLVAKGSPAADLLRKIAFIIEQENTDFSINIKINNNASL